MKIDAVAMPIELSPVSFRIDVPTYANGSGALAEQLDVFAMQHDGNNPHRAAAIPPFQHELRSSPDPAGTRYYDAATAVHSTTAERFNHVRGGAPLLAVALQGLPPPRETDMGGGGDSKVYYRWAFNNLRYACALYA